MDNNKMSVRDEEVKRRQVQDKGENKIGFPSDDDGSLFLLNAVRDHFRQNLERKFLIIVMIVRNMFSLPF